MGLEDEFRGQPKKREASETEPSREVVEDIIRQAKKGNPIAFTSDIFKLAVKYGIRDFRGASIPVGVYTPTEELSYEGVDLENAILEYSSFHYIRFGRAHLTGAQVSGTEFLHSHLEQSTIESIRLKNETSEVVEVSLMDRNIVIDSASSLWEMSAGHDVAGFCTMCEETNKEVLDRKMFSPYSRRAIMLFQEGKPIGYMKLKGSRTFLALRTVYTKEGEVLFWKGMVYALPASIVFSLEQLAQPHIDKRGKWRRVDVEALIEHEQANHNPVTALSRNNMRFLKDPELYARMSDLVDKIEAGKEPMIELLPHIAREVKKQKKN